MHGWDELAIFLDRRPPTATQLVVERFRRDPFTLAKVGAAVVGSFLGGDGDGSPADEGRRLLWLDDAGRTLRSLEMHPVQEGFSRYGGCARRPPSRLAGAARWSSSTRD